MFPEDTVLWNTRPYDFAPKNGEPMRHVYERMKHAVLEIVEKNQGKQICITSHGCAIRNFLCWAMGKPIEQINEVDWCDNTAVSIIDFDDAFNPTVVLAGMMLPIYREKHLLFQNKRGGSRKIVSKQNGMRRCFNENHGS